MLHLECHLEEPSAAEALKVLLPRILPDSTCSPIVYRGKQDMLRQLPKRLRGYRRWLAQSPGCAVLVLIDQDRDDCRDLKGRLEGFAAAAGLVSKTTAGGGSFQVLNRIAVTELEAWFLGDPAALKAAFPRLPESIAERKAYRDPEGIVKSSKALESLLQQHGYCKGGYEKVKGAQAIAPAMEPERNSRASFHCLCSGLRMLAQGR